MRGLMFPPALVFVGADYAAAARTVQRPQIGMAGLSRNSIVEDLTSGLCIWDRAVGHGPATGHAARTETIATGRMGEYQDGRRSRALSEPARICQSRTVQSQ